MLKDMRTIEIMVYSFDELTPESQQKAIENLFDINVDYDWWDGIYCDANEVGLKITGFDLDRANYCKGNFLNSAAETAKLILANHGENCETFKTAKEFSLTYLNYNEDEIEDFENDFLNSLLEDYKIILQNEYEYLTSREAIIETIKANEYEFLENGKLS